MLPLALLGLPTWAKYAIAAGAALVLVGGPIVWLRHDAAVDALNQAAATAAAREQEIRNEGNNAARNAERDGLDSLLRGGRF